MKTLSREELKIARKKYGYKLGNLISSSLQIIQYCKVKHNNYNNKQEEWDF